MAKDSGIKQLTNGKWFVDIRPNGRDGKRITKTLGTKGEAVRFKALALSKAAKSEEWNPAVKDKRKLSELVPLWWECKGYELKDGEKRRQKLEATIRNLGDPRADHFAPVDFLDYRKKRREKGITENTLNKEKVYLSAMFNELIRAGTWKHGNPLTDVKPLKMAAPELTFLSEKQVLDLLRECKASRNPNLLPIVKICLATGARWGEAEGLRGERVANCKVTYVDTKNGENRTVPIAQKFQDEILCGAVRSGPLFTGKGCEEAFERALARSNIKLPKGQKTHVLRHTFASHFVMKGGNIMVLNKILGHKTLQMTMRYAHLSPEHLSEAVKYNLICTE
jgi:site-specific recombinase XerD